MAAVGRRSAARAVERGLEGQPHPNRWTGVAAARAAVCTCSATRLSQAERRRVRQRHRAEARQIARLSSRVLPTPPRRHSGRSGDQQVQHGPVGLMTSHHHPPTDEHVIDDIATRCSDIMIKDATTHTHPPINQQRTPPRHRSRPWRHPRSPGPTTARRPCQQDHHHITSSPCSFGVASDEIRRPHAATS